MPREFHRSDDVRIERADAVLTITIDRPERRNALNPDVMAAIGLGLRTASEDSGVRAVVLTAVGDKAFCAGADLTTGTDAFSYEYHQTRLPFADLLRYARDVEVPLIARVNGTCMAGGMGLLGLCDIAVTADHALFGMPEVKIGMFPQQILSVLRPLMHERDLYEMCITGEPIDAQAARAAGLVNYVVPSAGLDDKVDWLLARILDKSPTAIRRGKYALRQTADMSFEQTIAFTESQIGLHVMTQDAREGLAAFNAKRKVVWKGL